MNNFKRVATLQLIAMLEIMSYRPFHGARMSGLATRIFLLSGLWKRLKVHASVHITARSVHGHEKTSVRAYA